MKYRITVLDRTAGMRRPERYYVGDDNLVYDARFQPTSMTESEFIDYLQARGFVNTSAFWPVYVRT